MIIFKHSYFIFAHLAEKWFNHLQILKSFMFDSSCLHEVYKLLYITVFCTLYCYECLTEAQPHNNCYNVCSQLTSMSSSSGLNK